MPCPSNRSLAVATLVALGALLDLEHVANACSAEVCFGQKAQLLPTTSQTIPVNAKGVAVFMPRGLAPAVTLKKTTSAGLVDVPFTVTAGEPEVIVPTESFEVDTTYELTVEDSCFESTPTQSTFTTSASAPLPTALGSLEITKNERGSLQVAAGASCTQEVDAAQLGFDLALAEGAKSWAALFSYETLVDGQPWRASANVSRMPSRSSSWQGPGKDLVYTVCGPREPGSPVQEGLAEGTHSVVMRATLASDPTIVLESNPLSFTLSCTGTMTTFGSSDHPSDTNSNSAAADGACTVSALGNTSSPSSNGIAFAGVALGLTVMFARRRQR